MDRIKNTEIKAHIYKGAKTYTGEKIASSTNGKDMQKTETRLLYKINSKWIKIIK
jgi:hypothetical protein